MKTELEALVEVTEAGEVRLENVPENPKDVRPAGCSQCGCEFVVPVSRVGGFSHCEDHAGLVEVEW